MGAYIGSALAKLGTSYLDEREVQAEKRRREMEDAQTTAERRSQFTRLLSADQFQRDKYATEQAEVLRERQQKEADRQAFPAKFKAAQTGDQEAMGWVLERFPQMASALTRPEPAKRALSWRDNVKGKDGKVYQVGFDPETGAEVSRAEQYVRPTASAKRPPTDSQRKTNALLMMAEQAYTGLRGFGTVNAPGWWDKQKSKVGMDIGNVLAPEKYQQLQQYALQLSDAWLRYTSGAAVPETEVQRFAKTFTPLPGDTPQQLAQKARAREQMIRAMRQGAGASIPDAAADLSATTSLTDLWPEGE